MKKIIAIFLLTITSLFVFSQEQIKFDLPEKYNWKVLSDQSLTDLSVIEYIPEKDSADNWEILLQITSLQENKVPSDTIMNYIFLEIEKNAPKAKLTFIDREKEEWLLFKIESPEFIENPTAESQLWYITYGKNSTFVCFIALKEKKLKKKFVKEWSQIFKSGNIIELSE